MDLKKKLGYFVLDNATSNDTCVEAILREIRPDLEKSEDFDVLGTSSTL